MWQVRQRPASRLPPPASHRSRVAPLPRVEECREANVEGRTGLDAGSVGRCADATKLDLTLARALAQHPREFVTVAIRTRGEAAGYGPLLAERVRRLDPDLPVYWLRTQQRAIEMGRIGPVILSQMFGVIGALGLVLAASGLYGVLAHAVLARTREIGIRRALGADAGSVLKLVGGGVGAQLSLGLGIGLALAVPWSQLLASETFQTQAGEPVVLALALLVVLGAAAVSFASPLRRALRVDPLQALRHE